jgi:hypothetical protein
MLFNCLLLISIIDKILKKNIDINPEIFIASITIVVISFSEIFLLMLGDSTYDHQKLENHYLLLQLILNNNYISGKMICYGSLFLTNFIAYLGLCSIFISFIVTKFKKYLKLQKHCKHLLDEKYYI